jgi:tetratricopeptide (TPR) repeat protein
MHKLGALFLTAGTAFSIHVTDFEKQKLRASDLVQKAYGQMCHQNFDAAVPTLCQAIKLERNSVAARRYLAFALIAQGQLSGALSQLDLISRLDSEIGLDLFMKGVVMGKIGEPTRAADFFSAAVQKEPHNDLFRRRAINALILLSRYNEASALSADGARLSTNVNERKFYEAQLRQTQMLSACVAKNRPCVR